MKPQTRKRRKNSKAPTGRFDTTVIFKYDRAKKNALTRFARAQRRSVGSYFQEAADRIIAENRLQPIADQDPDLSGGLK